MAFLCPKAQEKEEQSLKIALRQPWHEVLASSISYPQHMRAGGGSSSSQSYHPTDSSALIRAELARGTEGREILISQISGMAMI